ncbi:MAG: SusD/RagB family nutrient-binding outer membrane lipoprotein [Cyclobacteriaceae bacterium]
MRNTIITLTIIISTLASCDFGTTNVDPSRLSDVPVRQILPTAQAQTARNLGSVGARITGVVIQHFNGIDNQTLGYNTYLIDENAMDDFWATGLYAGAMKDCQIILEKAETENIPYYSGIARVLMAINLGIITSFWGDAPYLDAFQGQSNMTPSYDNQEELYEQIQQLLDNAIVDFNLDAGENNPGVDDLIYGGNRALWLGTARALKARYYMHLVVHDSEASAKALQSLSGGTIYSNEVEPSFPFGAVLNEANPIAYFGTDRPNQLVVNDYLLGVLDTKSDPRKDYYTRLKNGSYVLYDAADPGDDLTDLYWGQYNSPMPLISYSELLFIRAEANLRLGILNSAQSQLNSAIRANMEIMGIDDTAIMTYLEANANLSTVSTDEEKLAIIMQEKYVAMFGQGTIEAWVDYRRTGYPALIPNPEASESFNSSKIIPRRYLYPISERNANNQNVEIAKQNQGGHLLDNKLWAY